MNKHFIQVTNGLLPVMVLALLVIAFIAGQARANIPRRATAAAAYATNQVLVLNQDITEKAESLPQIVETLLTLPADVELSIRLLKKPANGQIPDNYNGNNQ